MYGARNQVMSRAYLTCPATQARIRSDMPYSALVYRNSGLPVLALHSELWMWLLEPARS